MGVEFTAGDWLRWMRGGELVTGVVSYVRRRRSNPLGIEYVTDVGVVHHSEVLEARSRDGSITLLES